MSLWRNVYEAATQTEVYATWPNYELSYSLLSAIIGSMVVTRRAGIKHDSSGNGNKHCANRQEGDRIGRLNRKEQRSHQSGESLRALPLRQSHRPVTTIVIPWRITIAIPLARKWLPEPFLCQSRSCAGSPKGPSRLLSLLM